MSYNELMSFHDSASFAWKADTWPGPADYTVNLASASLAQACEEVRSGRGFVVIRGLPADGTLEQFVAAVRGVGRHFGHLLSQNAQGELVGHVIDAAKELRPHSDITAMIAPQLLEPLYRGYHYHRLGEQGPDEAPVTPYRVPVFSIRKGQLSCRYQRAGIAAGHRELGVPLTAEDVAAFNLFDEIANAPENRLAFILERGDLLIINNYTVLHARSQFTNAQQPGRERRLVRLWLDAPGFRDVPKEFNLFKMNGVPRQEGRRASCC